ncbi:MAG: hypothetical protein ACYDGY_00870 [Acidimicrobiales bacterium]
MTPHRLMLGSIVAVLAIILSGCASPTSSSTSTKAVPSSFNPKQRSGPGWVSGTYVGTVHPNMIYDAKQALYTVNRAEEGAIPISSLSNAYLEPEIMASAQNVVKQELANLKGIKLHDPAFIGIRRSEHISIPERTAKPGAATQYLVNICFFSGWSAVKGKGNAQVAPTGYYSTAVTLAAKGTHKWQVVNANPSPVSGPGSCNSAGTAARTASGK